MICVQAAIEPGKAAAGISIGDPVVKLLHAGDSKGRVLSAGVELLDFGPVRVWAKAGVVNQIGVRGEYSGSIIGTAIGVGSTIQQVIDAIGPVLEDEEDNLIVANVPGICFETTVWGSTNGSQLLEENLDAKLTEVFVFSEQAS